MNHIPNQVHVYLLCSSLFISSFHGEETTTLQTPLRLLDPFEALNLSLPGIPVEDYPIFSSVPITKFSCDDRLIGGLYSDPEAQCQVFHICGQGSRSGLTKYSFLCPNGTIFNQEYLICDWWFNFDCDQAENLYSINDKIFESRERHVDESPSLLEDIVRAASSRISFPVLSNATSRNKFLNSINSPVDSFNSSINHLPPVNYKITTPITTTPFDVSQKSVPKVKKNKLNEPQGDEDELRSTTPSIATQSATTITTITDFPPLSPATYKPQNGKRL
ncbi:uncharacterized protein [Lepeophtheirus salmonis]|uniref:uncharacterized protein n=1 Tax=Lepeophtheirus salmonis TaxID=72036 RepID=UPI001AEA2C51|nr:uncharacterized protein LOC121114747 [Lepeophtheirus salmonis]